MRVRKAVIPAAGLGTRFLPATKAIPKEMLPIVDIPTLQLIVEEAVAAGVERFSQLVLVVSVRQKEPLGLGHAVLVARQAVGDEPVAVLLGDDLYDCEGRRPAIGQLIDEFERLGGNKGVIALMEVPAG